METERSVSELVDLLTKWREEMSSPNYDPVPTLNKLCELFEAELYNYCLKEPDPFDDRHPYRIDPNCVLAEMYTNLFGKNVFMNKLIMDYLKEHQWQRQTKNNYNLNIAACRLLKNLIPGLETTFIFYNPCQFKNNLLIQKLFSWAENTHEPMQTYATGFLASCVNIATNFKEDNNTLIPIILHRVRLYYTMFYRKNIMNQSLLLYLNINSDQPNDDTDTPSPKGKKTEENCILGDNNLSSTDSNASNCKQISSVDLISKLINCFKYLVSTIECQELLNIAYRKDSVSLLIEIISSSEKQNGCLTYEALKYLAALLFHEQQLATEFIFLQGLQKLLLIPKSSISSTVVSICFHYLSYWEKAMESICFSPKRVLNDLVKYALWMLECSHDSSRYHTTKFFSYSLHYKVIREIFDNYDGLCKLLNMVSELPIILTEHPAYSLLIEDTECSSMQMIRHVCAGLKDYFEAHLHLKARQLLCRVRIRDTNLSSKQSSAQVQIDIDQLSSAIPPESHWTQIDQFLKLGGLSLLLRIINMEHDHEVFPCQRCEMIKNALEILRICAVLPKVQLALCKIPSPKFPVDNQNGASTVEDDYENDDVGFKIILNAAKGELLDADIQKAALSIILTCIWAPIKREFESIPYNSSDESAKKLIPQIYGDSVIETICDCIKNNDGIMVLLDLMTYNTSITDIYAIRGLASHALAGLARCESVRQIISKLPLFNSGQLQSLMKNTVLPEKHQEYVTFKKYTLELMELVSGKIKSNGDIEASLANINRANVVAQTKINFNEQQLLLLIHKHLMAKGLTTTAESLVQEANLDIAEKKSTPFTYIFHRSSIGGEISPITSRHTIENQKSELSVSFNGGPVGAEFSAKRIKLTPIRLNVNRRSDNCLKQETEQEFELPMSKSFHKNIEQDLTLFTDYKTNSNVSLESIITDNLTNQHASCNHPMVTCPQFDLFAPHKCPDPKPRSSMCTNFAMRFSKNIHSRKLNQRLIHSRFCPTFDFHMDVEEAYFTCCEFLTQNRVAVGTDSGEIMVINLFTSEEELSSVAHNSYMIDLQCSNDEKILLSSESLPIPIVTVWSITEDAFNIEYSLNYEHYCTFSNYDQNRILCTRPKTATIYDLETSNKILTLVPRHSNEYSRNRACFDGTNKLVLSDGVLWDATAGKEIHKFDKLNQYASGIFHPNGLEIISNTEIWDLRTFRLLRTVPSLDKCCVTFSKSGEGMYLYVNDQTTTSDLCFETSFKTLDPNDYSNIATVDVQRSIFHLACNSYDTQIAVIENRETLDNVDVSILQIYDVGISENKEKVVEEEYHVKVDSDDESYDSSESSD